MDRIDDIFIKQTAMETSQFERLKSQAVDFSEIEGNCFYGHITAEPTDTEKHIDVMTPVKVVGNVMLLIAKGKLSVEVNTKKFEIEGPVTVNINHGSLIQVSPADDNSGVDMYFLMFSPLFLRDINISFSAISVEALLEHDDPVLHLSDREVNQLLRYFSLINMVMKENYMTQLSLHIISSITSALIYQLMSILCRRTNIKESNGASPRRSSYVQDFLRLVHVNYLRERSVKYYADQLFISPKYLSLLVKEATGRSATRWIDFFVITEAKNLLRYSGKNVQQVAYALNFSNQSAFGKYFKHITGMSPTDYQKS